MASPGWEDACTAYVENWTKYIGPVTTYAHLLASHMYPLIKKGVHVYALSAETIELLNKKVNKMITNQISNSKPIPNQLMRIANMKDSIKFRRQ